MAQMSTFSLYKGCTQAWYNGFYHLWKNNDKRVYVFLPFVKKQCQTLPILSISKMFKANSMWSICRRIRLQSPVRGLLPLNQKPEAKEDRGINVISQDSAALNAKPLWNPAEKLPFFHVSPTSVWCSGYQRGCEPWGLLWGLLMPQKWCKSCEISALMMMMVRLWWLLELQKGFVLGLWLPLLILCMNTAQLPNARDFRECKNIQENSPLISPLIPKMPF